MGTYSINSAFRRVLRNKKEYGGLASKDLDAQFLTVNFEAEALLKDAYTWQDEYQAQHEDATDEHVPLKLSLLSQCQRRPSHFVTLKELSKPRSVVLPPSRDCSPYKPDFTVSVRKRKSDKSHLRSRVLRDEERRKKQLAANSSLKACAFRNIAHSRLASNIIRTDYNRQKSHWTGQKLGRNPEKYTLEEALAMPGFQRVCWDGTYTRIIQDESELPLVVMGRRPHDFDGVVERVQKKFEQAHEVLNFTPMKRKANARGTYDAVPMGGSFGGGQRRPAMFAHTDANAKIIQQLREDPDIQRVARLCDHYFDSYLPSLHHLYNNVLGQLQEDNPEFERNFPGCSWAAAHVNFSLAVTLRHRDFLNLIYGFCAIFAVGSYSYQSGGHLTLWDLGLILEFPPGTVILIPSALLEHSNISISPGEIRSSITFYSAAGLFRWCHNGFMSDKDFASRASPKLLKKWKAYRHEMWREGLDLLKYDITSTT